MASVSAERGEAPTHNSEEMTAEPLADSGAGAVDGLSSQSAAPKPPSLSTPNDSPSSPFSATSAPLVPVNAARRPGPQTRASGLNSDIAAKMKAFSLSRQGTPSQNGRPGFAGQQPSSTSQLPSDPFAGGPVTGGAPQSGGGLRLPPSLQRPNAPNWNSVPPSQGASPRASPRPMGGLAAKRGLKPGGMKLSDAQKPAPTNGNPATQQAETGSQFNKFSSIVDTQKGTLNFKNKAVIHGSGIDFEGGSTFNISLDEVDPVDELGKGNYGTVFKVRHARPKMRKTGLGIRGNMSRQMALQNTDADEAQATAGTTGLIMAMKEIRLELEDSKFAAIIMELDILHRCVSPFIIDFYGAFFQEGSVYICIEYMDGGSVDKIYGDGVPEGVLKKITLSTIMGLKSLKEDHNIIHRDVKPTNILVNSRGQVKICDFGVSGNLVASIAKTNIGCQSYMAPERISGGGMAQAGAAGGTYSVQSDIWSLGLSIIECALGRYPYPPETYDNIFSQLSAIVDGDPPDLPADRFSEAAIDFVRGCLHKIPKLRPTYAMLLRHAWVSSLMKPPTISEDEEAEKAAEAGIEISTGGPMDGVPSTEDREVAEWVKGALEKKRQGKLAKHKKPALHEAPLNAVPGSPLMSKDEAPVTIDGDGTLSKDPIQPNPGVRVNSPELVSAHVESVDFAGNIEKTEPEA